MRFHHSGFLIFMSQSQSEPLLACLPPPCTHTLGWIPFLSSSTEFGPGKNYSNKVLRWALFKIAAPLRVKRRFMKYKGGPCGFGQSLGRPIVRSISHFFLVNQKKIDSFQRPDNFFLSTLLIFFVQSRY